MTKRVWSLLMALALCLSLLPVPVWAEETDDNTDAIVQVTKTARSGTETEVKQYTDLAAAFKDANSNMFTDSNRVGLISKVEVTLLENGTIYNLNDLNFASPTWGFPKYPLTFNCTNGVEVVIDLNGCTLKRTASEMQQGILSVTEGSVTLKNGTLDLDDSAADNPAQAIELPAGDNNQTLTLENMTVKVADINTANTYRTAKGYAIRAEGGELCIKSGAYGKVHINNQNSAKAQLSGGSYDSVACNSDDNKYAELLAPGHIFAKQDDNSTYIDPSDMGTDKSGNWKDTVKNIQVILCTHGGGFTDGVCNRCGYICTKHEYKSGNCSICGQKIVAQDGTNYYVSLSEAFEQVEDGKTIFLIENLPTKAVVVNKDKTVTLDGLNYHYLESNSDGATLAVSAGTLMLTPMGDGDIPPIVITNNSTGFAVSVTGGTLEFGGKATLTGGLQVIKGGELEGGLKEGSILIAGTGNAMNGGSGSSVSVRDSVNNQSYGVVRDLLGEGLAFAKYDKSAQTTGDIVSGNEPNLTEDVIVVAHPTHDMKDGTCACGYTCSKHDFANGVCKNCGYVCPHEHVTETRGEDWHTSAVCDDCNAQMAVKVTSGDKDTYYAQTTNSYGDDTLQTILNGADGKSNGYAPDGSTITLLTDGLSAYAFVNNSRSITLDLNGKNLVENMQGIAVDTGSTLTVTGEGSSTRTGDLDNNEYSYVFNVRGGTLKFDVFYFGGTFNGIRVGSGTLTSPRELKDAIKIGTLEIGDANAAVSFKAASFGKIVFSGNSGNVTLGNLLGMWKDAEGNDVRSGNAFQNADGTFLLYNTEISKDKPVVNVKIAGCPHDSVTNGTCDYCGTEHIVAVRINDNASMATYAAKSNDEADIKQAIIYALTGWGKTHGGTLKLLMDISLDGIQFESSGTAGVATVTYRYANAIDLNGCKITGGTLTLADGVNVTITDSSAGKTGSFANVTVNAGASLTVDGVAVDTITATDKTEDGKAPSITLKEGTKFRALELKPDAGYSGLVIADCLEPGSYLVGASGYIHGWAYNSDEGLSTVAKIQGTVTADANTGDIPYSGNVPEALRPSVTMNDGSTPELSYTWYYHTTTGAVELPSATAHVGETLDAFCVITARDNGNILWETAVTGYTLTVTKGQATVTKAPTANALTYNHAVQNLVTEGEASGGTMVYSTEQNGTYSETIPTGTNANNYTVWYKVKGDGNHNDSAPQSVTVTIARKPVTNPTITVESCTYNGQAQTPTVTVKDTDGTVIPESEYTVSYSDNINAGEGTVTIKNTPNSNYIVNGSASFTIRKAYLDNLSPATLTIYNNRVAEYTYDMSQLLPVLTDNKSYGELSWASDYNLALSNDSYRISKNTQVTLPSWKIAVDSTPETGTVGQIAVCTIKVNSKNYEEITLTLNIVATNPLTPTTVAPTLSKSELTYGDKLSSITLSGSMKYNDETVEGTFVWAKLNEVPNAGDTVSATWKFTPTEAKYAEVTGTSTIKVSKATPTGAPKYTAISGSGKTLADAGLTVNDSWPTGSVKWVDAEGHDLDSATEVKSNTAYKWVFTPTDNTNYNTIEGSVTLWHRSSSSSSGSTTPATPGKTEITTNPDGSIKITPPKNSGETKVEIPVKDVTPGTVAIIVKPDGTEEIVKDALPTENGIELTVDGSVTVKIVDNAKEFVDTKGHWAEDAIDFVSARGLVNGMTETTFAPNAPTTRAQLWTILARQADADLTGGSTWYEKAQAWAKTSGISDGSDPDGNITRAQMVTMLWRAAGSPAVSGSSGFTDVPGDSYYAQAVAWAAEKGITTGVGDGKFDPNGTCTRAQIATFLYRTYVNKI